VYCDVAHNAEGARALARTLERRGVSPVRLVVGMIEGKDHAGFLRALKPRVHAAHYCAPREERAFPAAELARAGEDAGLPGPHHATPGEAIDAAIDARRDPETILVTGSFFTVGSVLEHLGIGPLDPLWGGGTPSGAKSGTEPGPERV
jgi:dihydrofolate synthase/folylpolyglutamate synthase